MSERLFLHFGTLPESGRSIAWIPTYELQGGNMDEERQEELTAYGYKVDLDTLTVYEPGVSCFEIMTDEDGELISCIHNVNPPTVAGLVADRADHAYLITGDVSDVIGSDHEPILMNPEIIERVRVVRCDPNRSIVVARLSGETD